MTQQAVLLAAGKGKRMRPLTLETPKPLLVAGGKPLIVWWLEKLAQQGIRQLVINTHYLGEQLPLALGKGEHWGLDITYSAESQLLETGGGVLQALPSLRAESFLLVNSDVWCDPLPQLQLDAGQLAKLVVVANPEHNPQGDFHLYAQSQLSNQPTALSQPVTFAGISLLHPQAFSAQRLHQAYGKTLKAGEAFPLAPLLRLLIEQQLATAHYHDQEWIDIGTPARLAELQERLA